MQAPHQTGEHCGVRGVCLYRPVSHHHRGELTDCAALQDALLQGLSRSCDAASAPQRNLGGGMDPSLYPDGVLQHLWRHRHVQLGATGAQRGSGQGHQRLGRRQLPLVRQHHGDGHPDRTHVQTVPSDGQHERQLLPQRDLGGSHQQQQHTHADPHHQGPELHHLAGGHELCHQGAHRVADGAVADAGGHRRGSRHASGLPGLAGGSTLPGAAAHPQLPGAHPPQRAGEAQRQRRPSADVEAEERGAARGHTAKIKASGSSDDTNTAALDSSGRDLVAPERVEWTVKEKPEWIFYISDLCLSTTNKDLELRQGLFDKFLDLRKEFCLPF